MRPLFAPRRQLGPSLLHQHPPTHAHTYSAKHPIQQIVVSLSLILSLANPSPPPSPFQHCSYRQSVVVFFSCSSSHPTPFYCGERVSARRAPYIQTKPRALCKSSPHIPPLGRVGSGTGRGREEGGVEPSAASAPRGKVATDPLLMRPAPAWSLPPRGELRTRSWSPDQPSQGVICRRMSPYFELWK